MANKPLKFSIFQLIIETETPFTVKTFSSVEDQKLETFEIGPKEDKETLSIKRVNKECFEDRFIAFYFNEGNKFPYSPTVIDATDLIEKENPRPAEDIEMEDQFFVLIDVSSQRIYLSDQRKKGTFSAWLKEKIKKETHIKSIINEGEFLNKIKSVNRIYLSVVPNLFNTSSQDILSHNLARDIYSFGGEKARLEIEYGNTRMTDIIKDKFNQVLGRKGDFQEVTIIGRSDEGFESIFNLDEVISKLVIDVSVQEKTNLLDPTIVFNILIDKIKSI